MVEEKEWKKFMHRHGSEELKEEIVRSPTKKFLGDVETFLMKTGMPPTTFGQRVMNDGSFVFDLREGRTVTLKTMERVTTFIDDNAKAA